MSAYYQIPAFRIGGKMIRISISFFYGLGAAMREIAAIQPGVKLNDVWLSLHKAQTELNNLFGTQWFSPAVKSAYNPGQILLNTIAPFVQRTDWTAELTNIEAWSITNALRDFDTVLKSELNIADAYFVSRKAAYDTTALIMNAEQIFPADLVIKVPNAIVDIREGGKCLAFELSTAAGFHVLRATESVLRAYWDVASKGKSHPKQKNLGVYLKKMEDGNMGSPKVRACLKQIKDLHRNPLMHPEETLSLDEAIGLFGICQSAIGAMLKEIPTPPLPTIASP